MVSAIFLRAYVANATPPATSLNYVMLIHVFTSEVNEFPDIIEDAQCVAFVSPLSCQESCQNQHPTSK